MGFHRNHGRCFDHISSIRCFYRNDILEMPKVSREKIDWRKGEANIYPSPLFVEWKQETQMDDHRYPGGQTDLARVQAIDRTCRQSTEQTQFEHHIHQIVASGRGLDSGENLAVLIHCLSLRRRPRRIIIPTWMIPIIRRLWAKHSMLNWIGSPFNQAIRRTKIRHIVDVKWVID